MNFTKYIRPMMLGPKVSRGINLADFGAVIPNFFCANYTYFIISSVFGFCLFSIIIASKIVHICLFILIVRHVIMRLLTFHCFNSLLSFMSWSFISRKFRVAHMSRFKISEWKYIRTYWLKGIVSVKWNYLNF